MTLSNEKDVEIDFAVQKTTNTVLDFSRTEQGHLHQRAIARIGLSRLSFILMVIIPAICTIFYYLFFASDQYISETRFVVRELGTLSGKTDDEDSEAAGGVATFTENNQQAYLVADFILSPQMVEKLQGEIDLQSIFSRSSLNMLEKLPLDASASQIFRYFKHHIDIYIDATSGILVLNVRTFDAEDSRRLSNLIVELSESLLFQLSRRSAAELGRQLKANLQEAQDRYQKGLKELETFRAASGIVEPEVSIRLTAKLLTGLLAQRIDLSALLDQSQRFLNAGDVKIRLLESSISALDQQIQKLRDELAGAEQTDSNIAQAITTFSKLKAETSIAEILYRTAKSTLVSAENEFSRKSQYLAVFSGPTLPLESSYPEPFKNIFLVIIALVVCWSTLYLIGASIADHRTT